MKLPHRLPTDHDHRARLAALVVAKLVAEITAGMKATPHGRRLWRHPPPKNPLWFSRPGGLSLEERKARGRILGPEVKIRNARGIDRYKKLLHMRFEEIGREVMRNITQTVHRSYAGRRKDNVSQSELASWMFDRQRWYGILGTDNKLMGADRLLEAAEEFYEDLGVIGAFDVMDPRVLRFLSENARRAGWAITDSTYRTIMQELGRGAAEGLSIPNLRNALMEALDFLTRDRAELIARTETMKASNQGLLEGMRQSGVVIAKEWLATEDDRVCEFCESLDGAIIGLEEDYFGEGDVVSVEGASMALDYEDISAPPLHPDCRCTLLAVVDESYMEATGTEG
jgi:hypothetical protein